MDPLLADIIIGLSIGRVNVDLALGNVASDPGISSNYRRFDIIRCAIAKIR